MKIYLTKLNEEIMIGINRQRKRWLCKTSLWILRILLSFVWTTNRWGFT